MKEATHSLGERVARLRAAGKPIPKAWGHIRPVEIKGADLSEPRDVIEMVTRGTISKQLQTLSVEISHRRWEVARDLRVGVDTVMPEHDSILLDLYAKRRGLKALLKQSKKKKKKKAPKARKQSVVKLRVTRTVKYTYRETDNERLAAFYASPEWKTMRYEALRLHGGRCQCCGRQPPEVSLNVDHIKPLRVFWDQRLDVDNLQVLCGDCNVGKGARHADDWRA